MEKVDYKVTKYIKMIAYDINFVDTQEQLTIFIRL